MAKTKAFPISNEAASRASELKDRLVASADAHDGKRLNAGQKDYVVITRVAADLVGTARAEDLLKSREASVLSKELGMSGGLGGLSRLDDLSAGRNRPLGMDDAKWRRLQGLLASLNSKGYTNEEIASVARFERLLREAT